MIVASLKNFREAFARLKIGLFADNDGVKKLGKKSCTLEKLRPLRSI
jgi:hypothetical protein